MVRFKPGDRVRRIGRSNSYINKGNLATVSEVSKDHKRILLVEYKDSGYGVDCGFYSNYFELVSSANFSYLIY